MRGGFCQLALAPAANWHSASPRVVHCPTG